MSRNQTHIAGQEWPYPHRCCLGPALAAVQTLTLGTRRDMQGPQNSWADQRHVPRTGCRQEGSSRTAYHPQWKCWCPPSPPLAPTSPLDCGTFSICISLKHTRITYERAYWAEEMEILGPDSHLPILRKSPKQPGTRSLAQLPQLPRDGGPNLLMMAPREA